MRRNGFLPWIIGMAVLIAGCGGNEPVAPESVDMGISGQQDFASADDEDLLFLCVVDPPRDHTGRIDVLAMAMVFNSSNGDYRITLTAHDAHPFGGTFRVNINLFNQSTGTTAPYPSFFSDVVNDFALTGRTRQLALTGTDSRLLAWEAGDRVFTNSLEGTGNPDGISLFRSSVVDLPELGNLTNEDFIAFENTASPAVVEVFSGRGVPVCGGQAR